MFNKELVIDILQQICHATLVVQKRAAFIQSANDFLETDDGHQKLDAICMQLIAIGESIKNIDKITHSELFVHYSEIDWKNIAKMRDIIAHHYFDIDAEIVYSVCKKHIPALEKAIYQILIEFNAIDN